MHFNCLFGKIYCEACCGGVKKWGAIFLNQACAWFLKIDMVRTLVCMCVCLCVSAPGLLKTILFACA